MSTAKKVLAVLEGYRLKDCGQGQYRCNSPLRPGSDSNAFNIRIDDDEHGAYYDFVSEEAGSLYDLARQLGIDLPERVPVANTKRTYANMEEYAKAHGITAEILAAAEWKQVTYGKRPALVFPTATGDRWRFLDGKIPHYISSNKYQRCWYGLEFAVGRAGETDHPLVICNGEISVIVARAYGIPACCVTAGEKGAIPNDLLRALKAQYQGQIIIAFDCLDKGAEVAPQLAAQLQGEGFDAKAVDLMLGKGGDLADFCYLHGNQALHQLSLLPALKTPKKAANLPVLPRHRWYLLPADQLHTLPPLTYLLPGELIDHGLITLFGAPGSAKSFYALDLALRVCQLGKRVVYIAAEGEAGYKKRVEAWQRYHKAEISNLIFCIGSVPFNDPEQLTAFIGQITEYSPALVVVDTLARCMVGGDENSTRDMGLFINACETIIHAINGAVMLVHHVAKSSYIERGSGTVRASSDWMIKITNEDGLIAVECAKTKDENPFPTRYYSLLPITLADGQEGRVLVPADKMTQTERDPLLPNQQNVINTLAMLYFQDGALMADLIDKTSLARGTLIHVLDRLLQLGLIERKRQNFNSTAYLYSLTAKGKKRVTSPQGDPPGDRAENPANSTIDQGDRTDQVSATFTKSHTLKHRQPDQFDHPDHPDQFDQSLSIFNQSPTDSYYKAGL